MKHIPEVEDRIVISKSKDRCEDVWFTGVAGGAEELPLLTDMPINVEVIEAWYDNECGWRFHGHVLGPEYALAYLRRVGNKGMQTIVYFHEGKNVKEAS